MTLICEIINVRFEKFPISFAYVGKNTMDENDYVVNNYVKLEKRMLRRIANDSLDYRFVGNDVVFFGICLPDARLQIAFSVGWFLEATDYEGKTCYTLLPPKNFECSKNEWAGTWKDLDFQIGENKHIKISVPNWYYNNDVLLEGTYKS